MMNPVVHFEIPFDNRARMAKFYESAFGWQMQMLGEDMGNYVLATTTETGESGPKGEWQGTSYEDKGVILEFRPGRMIRYSHFSPLSGLEDKPENYHTVAVALSAEGSQTRVALAQDNNATEEACAHSEKNWGMMLTALKKLLEQGISHAL